VAPGVEAVSFQAESFSSKVRLRTDIAMAFHVYLTLTLISFVHSSKGIKVAPHAHNGGLAGAVMPDVVKAAMAAADLQAKATSTALASDAERRVLPDGVESLLDTIPDGLATVVITGFPEEKKNATTRTFFNGAYVEDPNKCASGKPTYWQWSDNKHKPFLFFCESGNRWALANEADWLRDNFETACPNYAALKPGKDLTQADGHTSQVDWVWVGGGSSGAPKRRAWEKNSTQKEKEYLDKDAWVSDIRISVIPGAAEGFECISKKDKFIDKSDMVVDAEDQVQHPVA